MTTIFDNPLTGYRFVDTQFGDTLQRIAYRELGDASKWPTLIAYNSLVYPFITDDPSQVRPGVILTGAQILVPAPVPVIQSTTDPALVFEVDVALDATGDLQADPSGDWAIVSGTANLDQALRNRLDTDAGELLFHSDYGSYIRQLVGAVTGPNAALLASKYATSCVLADDRVQQVESAVVAIVGDATTVSMQVNPVVGRPVQLNTSL